MKKLITSAGLVVLGAASLEAQQVYAPAPGLTSQQLSKPWSVSAAIRGFYDDNYALTPSKGIPVFDRFGNVISTIKPQDSFGFEVTPSVGLNWAMEQTYIGLNYTYGLKYFDNRPIHNIDQTHQADIKLSHAFTERYKIDIADAFVATSEPDLVAPNNAPNSTIRTRQDVIRNAASAVFTAGLTDQLSLVLGYSNTLYDYRDNGDSSLSALLDRMEHLASINLRWQVQPSTTVLVGYQYGVFDYTGDNFTGIPYTGARVDPLTGIPTLTSRQRDSQSHYIYVGADHSFNQQLDASLRLGAQVTDYYNLPGGSDDSITPYADGNVTYHMTPDSWIQLGVRHSRIATDGAALDQENTTAYGSLNYRVIAPLVASLIGQYQYNTFQNGQIVNGVNFANKVENFWLVGLNVSYEINKYLAAEAGYNYDRLDSDLDLRSFSRNRVYIGLRASY